MLKLDDLLSFHASVLTDLGFNCDVETGSIKYFNLKANKTVWLPLVTEAKVDITLPTLERMREEEGQCILFHPLTEDILKGESYTFKMMKRQGNRMLDMWLRLHLISLGAFINDNAKKVPKGKQKWLNQNPDWTEACQVTLKKILSKTTRSQPGKSLIGVYTHGTDTKFNGKSVTRLAVVSSAVLGLLTDTDDDVLGIKIPKKQRKPLIDLFNTILPSLNDGEYNAGSNSKVAPYFESYMTAWSNCSERLDEVTAAFGVSKIFSAAIPLPKYEWQADINKLSKLSRLVPPQRGNIGDDRVGSNSHSFTPAKGAIQETQPAVMAGGLAASLAPATTQPAVTQQAANTTPTPVSTNFGGLLRNNSNQNTNQPNNNQSYNGGNNNGVLPPSGHINMNRPSAFGGLMPGNNNNNQHQFNNSNMMGYGV